MSLSPGVDSPASISLSYFDLWKATQQKLHRCNKQTVRNNGDSSDVQQTSDQ